MSEPVSRRIHNKNEVANWSISHAQRLYYVLQTVKIIQNPTKIVRASSLHIRSHFDASREIHTNIYAKWNSASFSYYLIQLYIPSFMLGKLAYCTILISVLFILLQKSCMKEVNFHIQLVKSINWRKSLSPTKKYVNKVVIFSCCELGVVLARQRCRAGPCFSGRDHVADYDDAGVGYQRQAAPRLLYKSS
jgi:hypothetical protein